MEPIYSITDLRNRMTEVKSAADKGLVRITENGRGAYVFASQKALEEYVEKAIFEAQIEAALEKSEDDFEAGRSFSTRKEMWDAVRRMVDDG